MTAADAQAIAAWRYPGEYSFYDADADPDDLTELLDPAAGFLVVKLAGRVAEIGLGLRPDLTGLGLGESFVNACLRFAATALGAESYTLAVAAFNRRAIAVYERAGFRKVEYFEHFTNGGLHAFIRMDRAQPAIPHNPGLVWSGRRSELVKVPLLPAPVSGQVSRKPASCAD